MRSEPMTIEEFESLGRARMQELTEIGSSPPAEIFPRLLDLSWIRVIRVTDHPLSDQGAFYLPFLEFLDLMEQIVNSRGPGILGLIRQLEFNFSPRVQASYDPQNRLVRLNLGILLFANELADTYQWFDSLLFGNAASLTLDELARLEVPRSVQDELAAIFQAGEKGLRVSGKYGLTHPIGRSIVRFIMAHEMAHLIDSAESSRLQTFWRDSAWSNYDDALTYCLSVGWIDPERFTRFQRHSLTDPVARQWATEFVTDGLGFHTALGTPQPSDIDPHSAYPLLQVAVEIFFHSLIVAYRGDIGTETHPPPTLRCAVIRASQRKLHRARWADFLAEYWGAGLVASELITSTVRKIGGRS